MAVSRLKVLHIDTERTWRGGENQVRLLIEGARDSLESHVAVRCNSVVESRFATLAPTLSLSSRLPTAAWQIAKYCRHHGIEIIDAQSSHGHGLALMTRFFLPQVKIVIHRRVDFVPKRRWLNRRKYLSPRIDAYVAISAAIGRILIEYGIEPARVHVVRSAVDGKNYATIDRETAKKELRARFQVRPEECLIGNASALTPQKGYEVLLDAVKILAARGMHYRLLIAGEGELRRSLEERCIALGLGERVHFLGFVDDVPALLSGLDILAVSSRFEGLGTIILEGVHAGCGIVATDVGGIPEIIRDGETGLLAPKNDPLAFAKKLEVAMQSQDLRARLNENAKRHVSQAFSLANMVTGNVAIYQKLLGGSATNSVVE